MAERWTDALPGSGAIFAGLTTCTVFVFTTWAMRTAPEPWVTWERLSPGYLAWAGAQLTAWLGYRGWRARSESLERSLAESQRPVVMSQAIPGLPTCRVDQPKVEVAD